MDAQHSTGEITDSFDPGDSALVTLFAYGLEGSHKEHATGILLLLALAHKQLPSVEGPLQTVIENLTHTCEHYLAAQQTLHEASKQLLDAETQLQASFDASEKLLANFVKDVNITSLSLPAWLIHLLAKKHQEPTTFPLLTNTSTLQGVQSQSEKQQTLPALYFTCFSHFEVKRLGQPLALCNNRSGQTVLRYLVAQSGHRASVDKLIGVLWPECELEVARRRLQVAISEVRCSLNIGYNVDSGGGYILFKDWVYQLNPAISFRSDVDEFLDLYQEGRQAKENDRVAALYEQACQLYVGVFLIEDMYADWSLAQREQLSQIYQKMCNTLAEHYLNTGNYEHVVKWTSKIIKENGCDEAAHRQLIRAYLAQGRRGEALRQFQRCVQTLNTELGIAPMPETVLLCQSILAEHPS